MSESVTGGLPFGDIPADTEMFTAEQTVSKIASLQTILSGITEEGWSGLDNIISGIDSVTATFATKAELSGLSGVVVDRIAPISGDLLLACGVDSGIGVYRVCYWKNKRDGTSESVQLLDEAMFQMCGLCGNDVVDIVNEANRFLQYVSPTYGDRDGVAAGSRVLDPYYAVSGLGLANGNGFLTDRGTALSGFINKLTSGGGGGDGGGGGGGDGGSEPAFIPPNFWPGGDPQSGDTFCDLVSGCMGDLPDRVSGLESGFADLSGKIADLSGCCEQVADLSGCCEQAGASLEALAGLLENLESAIYSLEEAVSGMYEDIGDAIVDALTSEALEAVFDDPDSDEDIKKRINKARGKVNIPPVPPLPPGGGPRPPVPLPDPKDVADVVKPDLPDNPASGLVEPLEDISGILDNPETPEVDSISEAAGTAGGDSSGGEDAASSAESAAEAAGDVAGSFEGE